MALLLVDGDNAAIGKTMLDHQPIGKTELGNMEIMTSQSGLTTYQI